MTDIRLETTNTDAARRTLELNKFSQKVSMSSAESSSNLKNPANIRLEARLNGFKKVAENV